MQKFAVKIDLSIFFDDERKNVLILVDPQWEDVQQLQKRVEKIFDVERVRFLTNEGYFLPPQEPIEVVKFVDVLKAFIPSEVLKEKKRKKSSNKTEHLISGDSNGEVYMCASELASCKPTRKRRTFCSLENSHVFTSSAGNQAKRTKIIAVNGSVNENACLGSNKSNEIAITNEQLSARKKCGSIEKDAVVSPELNVITPKKNTESGVEKPSKRKKKRIRGHGETNAEQIDVPHKNSNSFMQTTAAATTASYLNASQHSPTNQQASQGHTSLLQTNQNNTKSHIHFIEARDITNVDTVHSETSVTDKNPKTKVLFRCTLARADMKEPRIFYLAPRHTSRECVQIQEILVLNPIDVMQAVVQERMQSCEKTGRNPEVATSDPLKIKQGNAVKIDGDKSFEKAKETNASGEYYNESLAERVKIHLHQTTCNASSIIAVDSIEQQKGNEVSFAEASNIIDLKETDEEQSAKCSNLGGTAEKTTNEQDFNTDITVENILPFSTELNKLPDKGDIVLFKVKHLLGSDAANFIAGRCEYTNKRTKAMKLILIDGYAENTQQLARFYCNLDDSTENKYINIKLLDMIDAKVFKMS